MRNKIRILALVIIFSTCSFIPILNATAQKLPGMIDSMATISLDFKDANLKDVLKMFSIQSGMNFIASEGVADRKVTLYLDKVPVQDAMDEIFKANNLSYDLNPDNDIFVVKDWGKMKIQTVTKVFYLKHAPVSTSALKTEVSGKVGSTAFGSGLIDGIRKVLSENGSVVEDSRTNALIVTDIPSRMSMIEETVKALDIPVPQVLLEVEMLDVSKKLTEKLGIKYGDTFATFTLANAASPANAVNWGFPFQSLSKMAQGAAAPASSIAYTASYGAILQFYATQTDTKYLARPRLLTLNNETAEIKITTQEVIGYTQTASTGSGSTASPAVNAERQETGITLRVTPQIDANSGEVTMFIFPTVKDAQVSSFPTPTTSGITGQNFFDPEERSTKSTVRVKDGDTVVIAGLIRNEKNETITKIPLLGDIPFIGAMFRHKNVSKDNERELLVFITPHIVKKDTTGANIAQGKKAMVPMREQPQVAVNDRKRLMNSSLKDFEVRTP